MAGFIDDTPLKSATPDWIAKHWEAKAAAEKLYEAKMDKATEGTFGYRDANKVAVRHISGHCSADGSKDSVASYVRTDVEMRAKSEELVAHKQVSYKKLGFDCGCHYDFSEYTRPIEELDAEEEAAAMAEMAKYRAAKRARATTEIVNTSQAKPVVA